MRTAEADKPDNPMALSKTAKIWTIVLAIPVILIFGAVIAAKIYFTSDKLKALVIPQVEDATHRHVEIGDISISFFPSLAVSIDGLKLSNPEGTKFDRDAFVSLENARLNLSLMRLISGAVDINRIILNKPRIYLEVTKAGEKNYSTKEPGETAPAAKPGAAGKTGSFLLSNFEINDGELESVNKKFDSRMLLSGFHQTGSAESKPGENIVSFEGESSIEKFSYGTVSSWYLSEQPISATERLSYNINQDKLMLDAVDGKLKDVPFQVRGTVADLQKPALMLDLTVSSPGVQMSQLLSLVPPEMLKKAKGITSSGDIRLSARITGESSETMNPGTSAEFTVSNGSIQYASLPKSITGISVSGSFDQPAAPVGKKDIGSFNLDRFAASLGTSTMNGKLRMTNFADPALSATLNAAMNLGEVHEFYPLEEGTELAGTMKANVSLDGRAKAPQTIKANGQMEFTNVSMKTPGSPRPIRNLNGTVTFNNQVVESKQLAMQIGESDMNVSFAVRNYLGMVIKDTTKNSPAKPSATVTLTSNQLRTSDLMSSEPKPASGAAGTKASAAKSGGMLPGIDMDANVSVKKLVTDKFTFNNAVGSLGISDGVVNLKNFTVNAFQGTIQSKGTLDMSNAATRPFNLDLDIKGVESNELLPPFTSFGKYLFGKFSTTTKLKGDLNDTLGLKPQTLLGDGKVQIFDGKLLGLPLTEKLSQFTGVSELRAVNFKDWTNAFSIENGRLNVKGLKVNAGQTAFVMEGSQGLDGTLDYGLTVKLPPELSSKINLPGIGGELLNFMKDRDGKLNLGFAVGGTMSEPNLRIDTKAQQEAAKRALEEKSGEAKKTLEDELKKKAAEGLKNLLKKP